MSTDQLAPPSPVHEGKQLVLRVVPLPGDTNANGDVFGGWLMSQIDLGGSVLPALRAKGRVATVAVKELLFLEPVHVGDLVSVYANVQRVGRTSITVDVEVIAARYLAVGEEARVAQATLTYVALDTEGRPRVVDPA